MSIGKTLVTVILAAHLLSCFWFWVHCYDALQQVRISKRLWVQGNPAMRPQRGPKGLNVCEVAILASKYILPKWRTRQTPIKCPSGVTDRVAQEEQCGSQSGQQETILAWDHVGKGKAAG